MSGGPASFTDVHEAGHGVIASHLRIPFEYVTSIPDSKSDGRLKPRRRHFSAFATRMQFREGRWEVVDPELRAKKYHEQYIIMTFAGAAATRLLFNSEAGSGQDKKKCAENKQRTSSAFRIGKLIRTYTQPAAKPMN